jgi:hypothetical protein
MQIRLYLDEDAMARSLVREFRARGIDITTALGEQTLGNDDFKQLEFSKSENRVFYTYNIADYARLHVQYIAEGKSHGGMILVHQSRFTVGEQIKRTLKLITTLSREKMQNRAEYLSSWG